MVSIQLSIKFKMKKSFKIQQDLSSKKKILSTFIYLLIPFQCIKYLLRMKVLRKINPLSHSINPNQISDKTINKSQRLKSQMIEYQHRQPHFRQSQILIKTQYTSQQTHHKINTKKNINFQYQDYQKILMHNKLTLDFTQPAKDIDMPEISTFKKTQKLLIPSSLYKQFKEIHKVNGHFQSVLSQVEREYNIKKMKININKDSKITFRQNLSMPSRSVKQSSSENQILTLSKIRRNGFSFCIDFTQKLKKKIDLPAICGRQNKWNLKDFYDPLVQQFQQNEIAAKKIKERQKLLSKFRQIDAQCFDVESSSQTSQSIQTFAKYTKNMSEKLVKKQRKIDKIYFYSY